jgi:hypothetical protein
MRALAGPAMLLVIVGGFALYRHSAAPAAPSRDFLDLELAGADDDHTGSCYSLSTVIVASTAFSNAMITWKPAGDEAWTLSLEDVVNGGGGPVHVFRHLTFKQRGDQVRLESVDASDEWDDDVATHIDALLEAPNERRSTPVERCREPGATGYQFKRRK